jgi:hypothetical protein
VTAGFAVGLFSGIGKIVGSVVGGITGATAQSKAAQKAADAQAAAAQAGIDEQHRQFDVTQQNLQPWLTAGTQALGQQGDLLGLNGTGAQSSSLDALRASPLFKSLYDSGEEAVLQNASATGGLRGGNTQRGLADFGADTFAQLLQYQLGQLGGISGAGQQTGTQLGQFGANTASNVGSLLTQQGSAQAGGILAAGSRDATAFNQALQIAGMVAGGFGGGGSAGSAAGLSAARMGGYGSSASSQGALPTLSAVKLF